MTLPVLGIDISKRDFHCVLRVGEKKYRRTFRNHPDGFSELMVWLAKHTQEPVHACLEATGTYGEALAEFLYARQQTVSVVNPKRIHDYAKSKLSRNKTDALDAELIADFCLTQHPDPWAPLPEEVRELRDLLRHLEDLLNMHTQENNRLLAGVHSKEVLKMLEQHLAFLEEQIEELKKRIQKHIDDHPDLKKQRDLLASIPGIGELTAAKLLGYNIQSFTSTRDLVAYAGLNPQKKLSGTSVHGKPQLSKVGSGSLRKAMYFPAVCAMRYNPIVKEFSERLKARRKHTMVVVGAAMRKLLCLALGVLKSGQPFDPHYVSKVQFAT